MNEEEVQRGEETARSEFLQAFGAEYELATRTLSLLDDGLSLLDGQPLSETGPPVQTWLAVAHRNSMRGALTSLSRGYFREAVALIRAGFEAWGWQKYLKKHPEKAQALARIDVTAPFKIFS